MPFSVVLLAFGIISVAVPTADAFDFSEELFGEPGTLSASVQALDPDTGDVFINGVDTAQPSTPFDVDWGDGSPLESIWFPFSHTYSNNNQNYVVTITSHYEGGGVDTVRVAVRFIAPVLNPISLPLERKVIIDSSPISLESRPFPGYGVPALTYFEDQFFDVVPRSSIEYVLHLAAELQHGFANGDVLEVGGGFQQHVLRDTEFGGMYSLWYTDPVAFGAGDYAFSGTPQYSSFFHEMGHNVSLNSPADFHFGGRIDGNANAIFSETMAQIFAHATSYVLLNHQMEYGIEDTLALEIELSARYSMQLVKNSYLSFVDAGAPFTTWNVPETAWDETFGTFMTLAFKFFEHAENSSSGYGLPLQRMMRLLQLFDEDMADDYARHANTVEAETYRSTLMVAALSHAFDTDLREEMRALNFPIDDAIHQQLLQEISDEVIFRDGFESYDYWPNSQSYSNSDPWLIKHHDQLRIMRPRVLVLNFMNDYDQDVAKTELLIQALRLSTTYHGYADSNAKPFLEYEVARYVDLRDPPGTETIDGNSTLYPRVPHWSGGNNFAYEQLYTEEYAGYFGYEDSENPGSFLNLEQLLEKGIIHEVWFFAYHGDHGAPYETIEIKQYYDSELNALPGVYGGAGNGHYPGLPWTGRSLRFTFINGQRGVGCALENFGHALEGMAHYNFSPYWRNHFYEFAGFDLDIRWGLPFASFYSGVTNNYPEPDRLDWIWNEQSGTVENYYAVGGNVHFMPAGRDHYDLDNTQQVYSTIEHYRLFDGPQDEDTKELWDRSKFTAFETVAPDCMGPWLVYWRMNMPGLLNSAIDQNGMPMKNWWVFLFY